MSSSPTATTCDRLPCLDLRASRGPRRSMAGSTPDRTGAAAPGEFRVAIGGLPRPEVGPASGCSHDRVQIGGASCRERVCQYVSIWVVAVSLKKINNQPTQQKD